jgi:hypothetical protein
VAPSCWAEPAEKGLPRLRVRGLAPHRSSRQNHLLYTTVLRLSTHLDRFELFLSSLFQLSALGDHLFDFDGPCEGTVFGVSGMEQGRVAQLKPLVKLILGEVAIDGLLDLRDPH